jgi:hypothetical protein
MALAKGFLFCVLAGLATVVRAGELLTPSSFVPPKVAEASNEGELAMKGTFGSPPTGACCSAVPATTPAAIPRVSRRTSGPAC